MVIKPLQFTIYWLVIYINFLCTLLSNSYMQYNMMMMMIVLIDNNKA